MDGFQVVSGPHVKSSPEDFQVLSGQIKAPLLDRLDSLIRLVSDGKLPSLVPLLEVFLRWEGRPYNLDNHFPFEPLFSVLKPKRLVVVSGRQVAKSTSLSAAGVMTSACIPHFKILYVLPLYEQTRRLSNNYVRPLIEHSPVRGIWLDTSTENSVLQRSFRNQAKMIFSFAGLDVDRVRGVSADEINIDEVQDIDTDHLAVIAETAAASRYGLEQFTGTPKTLDNTIHGLWLDSSMAEWFIPCTHCTTNGKPTQNIPSIDHHLLKIIGPMRSDISAQRPATICHKCRQSIYPRMGRWVHRNPEKLAYFPGYHIPQVIMPMHNEYPMKWHNLLYKQEHTAQSKFYNECLGESTDVGTKLVSESELRAASCLPWKNNPDDPDPKTFNRLPEYTRRVLAVDWGGGGEKGVSYTVLAVLGVNLDGTIDCIWGKRLMTAGEHKREAEECLHWFRRFMCDFIIHDYTGAGAVRETVLMQLGMPLEQIIPVSLQRTTVQDLIVYHPGTTYRSRGIYQLDKARSLLYTCQAIKNKQIAFFEYDRVSADDSGLVGDFLALIEEKTSTQLAGDVYKIVRNPALSDDFAQAVNLGASLLWHITDRWPDLSAAAERFRLSDAAMSAVAPADAWSEYRADGAGFGAV